jgi:hypothetical protein
MKYNKSSLLRERKRGKKGRREREGGRRERKREGGEKKRGKGKREKERGRKGGEREKKKREEGSGEIPVITISWFGVSLADECYAAPLHSLLMVEQIV